MQRPLTEDVLLRLGSYSWLMPAGSFTRATDGAYAFNGTIGGVKLSVQLRPAKRGAWDVKANGKPVRGLTSPVSIALRIGNDQGVKQVPLS